MAAALLVLAGGVWAAAGASGAAAVQIAPEPGYYSGSVPVTLVSSVPGAELRWTLDGRVPTLVSRRYTSPISLGPPAQLQVRAFTNGLPASGVVVALFLDPTWDDGIPSPWRDDHFGGAWWEGETAQATADPDEDGSNNYEEYVGGSDPKDAESRPEGTWRVSTYAGSTAGYADGPRREARFEGEIMDLVRDGAGRLWLLESAPGTDYDQPGPGGYRIRRIEADGTVVTVAGGEAGYVDGPAAEARFSLLYGLVLGAAGDVFVVEAGNHAIRRLDPAGIVSTFAGSVEGYRDGVGTEARFGAPMGLAGDAAGNLYVADFFNLRVRQVKPDGTVTTYANLNGVRGYRDGPRLDAWFESPNDLCWTRDGGLLISDWANHLVRKISREGQVTTFAQLPFWPERVSEDAQGRVYVGGSIDSTRAPRMFIYTAAGELAETIASPPGYVDGELVDAQFEGLGRVVQLPNGDLLVGDRCRVRRIQSGVPELLTVDPPSGTYAQSVAVSFETLAVEPGQIRYTMNGSEPAPDSPAFLPGSAPVVVERSATLKARVFVNGNAVSDVVTGVYEILNPPPAIVVQPKPATVLVGGSATFSVTATGGEPLRYAWLQEGLILEGATNATFKLQPVTPSMEGRYRVVVSNPAGAVTSAPALLTVRQAPQILVQPVPQTARLGGAAAFYVEATATLPLQYQWFHGTNPVAQAVAPGLVLNHVQPEHAGSYSVSVSNADGEVHSEEVNLVVVAGELSAWQTSQGVAFQFAGEEGESYRVEWSADLIDWQPLATVLDAPAEWPIVDPTAAAAATRFYRVIRL